MATYSVAEAKNSLTSLINKAIAGEEVVITRHGAPVAEIRSRKVKTPEERVALYAWLKAQRDSRKSVDIDSVTLLNQMYDETEI